MLKPVVHLPLPPQPKSGKAEVWQLQPSQQKVIMSVEFEALEPGYFAGRVYIVTDHDTIVIPFGIAAINDGVHPALRKLDFGELLGTQALCQLDCLMLAPHSDTRPLSPLAARL